MRSLFVLLAFCGVAFASKVDTQMIAPYVEIRTNAGTGSGVVIDLNGEQVVLTAGHVARDAGDVVLVKKDDDDEMETHWNADVVAISEDADLALIKPRSKIGFASAKLCNKVKPERGENAWYVGTHSGLHAMLEKTIVNQPHYRIQDEETHKYMLMNGNAWYGNSGGPAFVKRGDDYYVVGIVVRLAVLNPRTPICAEPIEEIAKFLGDCQKAVACPNCKCGDGCDCKGTCRCKKKSAVVSDAGREKELVEKIGALVNTRFDGDVKKCFRFYAGADMLLSYGELLEVLQDAKVGAPGTRPAWAAKIMERLDTDKSGQLSWEEIAHVFRERKDGDVRFGWCVRFVGCR